MREQLRSPRALGLTTAMALGGVVLVGCSTGDSNPDSAPAARTKATAEAGPSCKTLFKEETDDSGVAKIEQCVKGTQRTTTTYSGRELPVNILTETCMGKTLRVLQYDNETGWSRLVKQTPDHNSCTDRRMTHTDSQFEAETEVVPG